MLPFSPQVFGLNSPASSQFTAGPSRADFEAAFAASKGRMGSPADLMAMSNMRIGSSPASSAWAQEWNASQTEGQQMKRKCSLVLCALSEVLKF